MTTVSVLIGSYNQVEYLDHAIQSVLQQTYEDWELLILDNGSTDGSQDIVRKYADHPKVRTLLYDVNRPVTQRWNHAISQMKGEYVSILCADDYYLPHKLADQVRLFEGPAAQCGIVYSPGLRINVDTKARWIDPTIMSSGWILRDLLNGFGNTYIHPISQLIRRECFERYPYHEDLFIEGESIFLRFALSYRFHFDPKPTVVMRDHGRNAGRSLKNNLSAILTCLERLLTYRELQPPDAALLDRVITRFLRNSGWMAVRVTNDPTWSRDMFLRSLARDWRQGLHPKTVAGMAMTMLPPPLLKRLNALLFRMRPVMYHVDHVAD